MDAPPSRYRTTIGATSLIVGPALMAIGDLLHPAEHPGAAAQVAIILHSASRWYAAHLLLFVGLLLLVPGFLAITTVAMDRRPAAGYAARLLMLIGMGAFSAVIAFETLLGRFIAERNDQEGATALLDTFQSPEIWMVLVPGLLAFFIGTALAVASLASAGDPFRLPALGFAVGASLILGEIILAKVLLSQIGNIIMFISGSAFARLLLRHREGAA